MSCSQCGLPAPAGERFCCYGCELAFGVAAEAGEHHARLKGALTFCLLLSMFVMMLSLFLYAEDVYGPTASPGMAQLRELYRLAASACATPVVLICGLPLARRAAAALWRGRLTMDALVGLGAFAAYGLSLASIARGGAKVYFDTATSALLLATAGRYLESSARSQASRLLQPNLAAGGTTVERFERGAWREVAAASVAVHDRLRIGVERALPVDAVVERGTVEVSLAALTGESVPRAFSAGDVVPAGAVPVSAPLECVALKTARDSTLSRLESLTRELRERPVRLARLADRFAQALTPVAIALALAAFGYWAWAESVEAGVVAGLAVVLAACPCTYGVAVPLALWLALKRALDRGALVRGADVLERLAAATSVAFDKTGTLTERALRVSDVEIAPGASRDEVLALAAGLEAGSAHPVGRAVAALAADLGIAPAEVEVDRHLPGFGVTGRLGGAWLFIGRSDRQRAELTRDGEVLATFRIEEALRPEAAEAVAELRADGLDAFVLTGDRDAEATSALGLPAMASLSAAEKARHLDGRHVAMVGDGTNDAPALASVPSFALGHGADLSRGVASVVLARDDLRLVPWTLRLARRAVGTARRALVASTVYNAAFLALAAAGMLKPVWAGLSMLTSSVLTVALVRHGVGGEEPARAEPEAELAPELAP